MRINAISKIYETYVANNVADVSKAKKTSSKDEVALSETAKDFQAIYKALIDVPDVREDKVKAIKESMENGTYKVTATQVADKILSQIDIKG